LTLLLIFLLGAGHGLQPDHAAAAVSVAARYNVPAWNAAIRIALGHCAALLMLALVLLLFPAFQLPGLERWSDIAGATALIVLGSFLIRRFWSPRESSHERTHSTPLAVGLGWLLGLSGARSAALLLPMMAGPRGAAAALISYSAGIGFGVAVASGGVDLVRHLTAGRIAARWLDGALGVGTMASGWWLLYSGARP
jgi:hypothetical protein